MKKKLINEAQTMEPFSLHNANQDVCPVELKASSISGRKLLLGSHVTAPNALIKYNMRFIILS